MRLFATRHLYQYLQHHSHRFFSNDFPGALAQRISETANGTAQIAWALINEYLPSLVILLVGITLLYHASPALGHFFFVWAMLFTWIAHRLAAHAKPWGRDAAAALDAAPCPSGRVRVPGAELRIVQPERKTWPGYGKGALPPIAVAPFCIDASPARWLDVTGDVREARKRCGGRATGVACALTRDEAEAACRRIGARLPTVGEWEAVVRSGKSVDLNPKGSEWAEDRAPPRVLGFEGRPVYGDGLYRAADLGARVTDGEARWSWNQEPQDPRYPKVGFRCVGEGAD
jgi:hypothetical protein